MPVRGVKQRTVLALLALQRGRPISAERLIDALWGDGQVANPANALQAQVGQLRRTLGGSAIVTSEAGYALDVGPDDVDAARFEQLVAKGRRLLEEGGMALASSTLRQALQLRRGEPLSEFAYAGFADAERAHLDDLTLVATEARAEADLASWTDSTSRQCVAIRSAASTGSHASSSLIAASGKSSWRNIATRRAASSCATS